MAGKGKTLQKKDANWLRREQLPPTPSIHWSDTHISVWQFLSRTSRLLFNLMSPIGPFLCEPPLWSSTMTIQIQSFRFPNSASTIIVMVNWYLILFIAQPVMLNLIKRGWSCFQRAANSDAELDSRIYHFGDDNFFRQTYFWKAILSIQLSWTKSIMLRGTSRYAAVVALWNRPVHFLSKFFVTQAANGIKTLFRVKFYRMGWWWKWWRRWWYGAFCCGPSDGVKGGGVCIVDFFCSYIALLNNISFFWP